jgi:putative ABC transport system permease protein
VRDVPPIVPGRAPEPEIYWSNRQLARWGTFIVIRTAGDPSNLVGVTRSRLHEVDPDLDLGTFRTMQELADRQMVRPRFNAALLGSFALIALILASVGLYAVISYAISSRAHEIGIRIALGADAVRVIRTVLSEGAAIIAAGIVVGAAGAWAVSDLLANLVYGIEPKDGLTYLTTAFLLAAIALLACAVPALRASRIDPVRAMRIE